MALETTLNKATTTTEARRALRDLERSGIFLSVPYKTRCTLRIHVDGRQAYIAGEGYLRTEGESALNYYQSESEATAGAPRVVEIIDDDHTDTIHMDDGRHYHLFVKTPLPADKARLLSTHGTDVRYTPKVTLDDEMDD